MEVSMSKTRRGKYTDNRICYISKCKGDMRLYLRRKGKLPCFSYLVRGKSFSFYRGKIQNFLLKGKENGNYFLLKGKVFPFSPIIPLMQGKPAGNHFGAERDGGGKNQNRKALVVLQ